MLGKARLAPTQNERSKTAEIRSNAKSYSWNFENKQCHYRVGARRALPSNDFNA
jgi:hypothetical protein